MGITDFVRVYGRNLAVIGTGIFTIGFGVYGLVVDKETQGYLNSTAESLNELNQMFSEPVMADGA